MGGPVPRSRSAVPVCRIICLGNRLVAADAAGGAVCDRLRETVLPDGVEVIDGGLGGLDLLRFLEGADRVVLVDSVLGFGEPGEVVNLDPAELAASGAASYGHHSGLAYLLAAAPLACDRPPGEITVVGVEATHDRRSVERAAAAALAAATEGGKRNRD